MEKIVKMLIVLMMVVVILIIFIIALSKNIEPKAEEYTGTGQSEKIFEKNSNGFEKVMDSNVFYSVLNIMDTFIDIYKLDVEQNVEFDDDPETNLSLDIDSEEINKYLIKDENKKKHILYSLLDKKYIEKYNITEENVDSHIIETESNIKLIPIEMKVRYNQDMRIFLLHCYVENVEKRQIIGDKYFVIRTDNKNYTIEPILNNQYENIDEVNVDQEKSSIEKNDYNIFSLEMISVAKSVQKYIEHYRYLITYYPELAYYYLEEEYREKRFSDIDNYKEYITKNKEELSKIQVVSYLIENDEEGNRKYICKDQYENLYIFNEESILKYSLVLDTYTLDNDEFITTYKNSDEQEKVMLNVDKWIQMLNNRDYTAAFNVLDETYRNNNFNGDVNIFETYMRSKYPSHYEVEYSNFNEQAGDIYSQDIFIKEIGGNNEVKEALTIIMQLQDNMNFVMSFSKQ